MNDQSNSIVEAMLSTFSEKLQAPHIPGEHHRWINDVAESFNALCEFVNGELLRKHEQQYDMIREEDIALQPRIEQLREQDQTNNGNSEALSSLIEEARKRLDETDGKVESEEQLDAIFHRGTQLVAEFRKQEQAIRSLVMESVNRDRGVAD